MTVENTAPACRFCDAELRHSLVDLGMSPLCNTQVEPHQLNHMEPFYPLHAYVCEKCFLVQLGEFVSPDAIFSDYAYFSSYSDSWVQHAKRYADMAAERFKLGAGSKVMEIASNDGYLLQHFVAKKIPVLGIEPAANVAKVAVEKGIPTTVRFFGTEIAKQILQEHGPADLLLGNNVLAHVPKLNDFVGGMKVLLKPGGTITMEFPHLMRLMEENQFDTIYHEHFSYFSFYTVQKVFAKQGLTLFDVEELPTHGGSLRIFGRHAEDSRRVTERAKELTARELAKGVDKMESYASFGEQVRQTKRKLLDFMISGHHLATGRSGQHSIRPNDYLRVYFRWTGENAEGVEIVHCVGRNSAR